MNRGGDEQVEDDIGDGETLDDAAQQTHDVDRTQHRPSRIARTVQEREQEEGAVYHGSEQRDGGQKFGGEDERGVEPARRWIGRWGWLGHFRFARPAMRFL